MSSRKSQSQLQNSLLPHSNSQPHQLESSFDVLSSPQDAHSSFPSTPSRHKKNAFVFGSHLKRILRTRVSEYHWKKLVHLQKMETNSFYKMRMMSKKFLRKLSEETEASMGPSERKISWNDEVEVLVFKKEQKADTIGRANIRKESLTETEKYHTLPSIGEIPF